MRAGFFSFLFAAALAAQPGLPTAQQVVERFDAAQAKVQSLQTPFTLTIRRALLRTPTVTKGTLYLQGSEFVHFAFAPPEDLVLHLTQKELLSYSPVAGQGERLKIGLIRNHDRRFLGLGQQLSELSDYFQLAIGEEPGLRGCFRTTLTPRSYKLKKRFQTIFMVIDAETYLPRQITWTERSGDTWLLELGPLQLNGAIPAAVKGFKVPEGAPLRADFSFFATRKSK